MYPKRTEPFPNDPTPGQLVRRPCDIPSHSTHKTCFREWVVCPDCNKGRWTIQRRGNSRRSGRCMPCTNIQRGLFHRGPNSPNWRGGRGKDGNGYIYVRLVDVQDPLQSMAHRVFGKSDYVLEHRLVMARWLGRPLEKWETVHHRNGDRSDNRIENLQLWKGRHGKGIAASDYHCSGCRCDEL